MQTQARRQYLLRPAWVDEEHMRAIIVCKDLAYRQAEDRRQANIEKRRREREELVRKREEKKASFRANARKSALYADLLRIKNERLAEASNIAVISHVVRKKDEVVIVANDGAIRRVELSMQNQCNIDDRQLRKCRGVYLRVLNPGARRDNKEESIMKGDFGGCRILAEKITSNDREHCNGRDAEFYRRKTTCQLELTLLTPNEHAIRLLVVAFVKLPVVPLAPREKCIVHLESATQCRRADLVDLWRSF
jgi:hypothetical protein